jgi:uncharacterized protein with HEPN domain
VFVSGVPEISARTGSIGQFVRVRDRATALRRVRAPTAEAVASFIGGRDRPDLTTDRMLLFAVVRAIEVLGEAAARTSPETRPVSPDVPWPAIIGMRNRLIHDGAA